MQIFLDISDMLRFNDVLREKIDKVKDLHKYLNVLPKSIQINTPRVIINISFIEHLFKAFDKSIYSFNDIICYGSVSSIRFFSSIAKKVEIKDLYYQ